MRSGRDEKVVAVVGGGSSVNFDLDGCRRFFAAVCGVRQCRRKMSLRR